MIRKPTQIRMTEEDREMMSKIQLYYDHKGYDPMGTSEVISVCIKHFFNSIEVERLSLEKKFQDISDKMSKKLN